MATIPLNILRQWCRDLTTDMEQGNLTNLTTSGLITVFTVALIIFHIISIFTEDDNPHQHLPEINIDDLVESISTEIERELRDVLRPTSTRINGNTIEIKLVIKARISENREGQRNPGSMIHEPA